MTQEHGWKSEPGHEPAPGYRRIFYIVLVVVVLYLVIVMVTAS